MKNDNSKAAGIGFPGLLTIVFIVLKLCHVISWKWIWVLSPTWIMCIIFVAFAIIYAIAEVRNER